MGAVDLTLANSSKMLYFTEAMSSSWLDSKLLYSVV